MSSIWDILKPFYNNNVFTLKAEDCPSELPSVKALLEETRVFDEGVLTFATSSDPEVAPTRVILKGNNKIQFTVNPVTKSKIFSSLLEFFYGEDEKTIEMKLTIERQPKNPGAELYFHLDQDFTAIENTIYADISFDVCHYVVISIAENIDGRPGLAKGINLDAEVRLIALSDQPPSPFKGLAFLWAAEQLNSLPFGGEILPPPKYSPGDQPVFDFLSPLTATGLEIGNLPFQAEASTLLRSKDQSAKNGIGVNIPLELGSPVNKLLLKGKFTDAEGSLTLNVYDLPTGTLSSLDPFTKLSKGTALGAIVPSQFPLGLKLKITGISAKIGLNTQALISLQLGVAIEDLEWTLIPGLIELDEIGVRFALKNPISAFTLQPSLYGRFELDTGESEPAKFIASARLPAIPSGDQNDWVFALKLEPPASGEHGPNLFALFNKLFGTPNSQLQLFVDELDFAVQPFKKTYSAQALIRPGDDLNLPLGIVFKELQGQFKKSSTSVYGSFATTLMFMDVQWDLRLIYSSSGGDSSWRFSVALEGGLSVDNMVQAVIPPSWSVTVPDSLNVKFSNLYLSLELPSKDFNFNGGVEWAPDIIKLRVQAGFSLKGTTPADGGARQYSGEVLANIELLNLQFQAKYAFAPKSKEISFAYQNIVATYTQKEIDQQTHKILSIRFGDSSIGQIIALLIKAADPNAKDQLSNPWSILNDINLNGLLIEIDFTSKIYKLQYRLDKNFTFITIDTIGIEYKKQYGKGKIALLLTGTFLGKTYTQSDPLTWDPVNDAPPPVPGAGKASFDVLYLGVGQHLAIRGAREFSSVDQVINALAENSGPVADPGKNPLAQYSALEFSDSSGWIIASRLLVNGFLTIDIVFNDPELYGLLITASGPRAGNFKGLRFEILYQKISDSIGLWHIDLVLPKNMRRLQMGSVNIVLPEITVDIFTNGDFKVDFGFPVSITNYSRCFSVEVFPFIGYGGFYFAKLSAETANNVPKVIDGKFDPVIAAGFALAMGLGKTIDIAILSGGIYITVTGIIEGVFGQFNPDDSSKSVSNYISMKGTIAIVGRVYASVDFGIIKASVDLTAYAAATILCQSYEPILIALEAGVRVSVKIKVLFVIIRLSFSATIRESFTIGSASTPPWQLESGSRGAATAKLLSMRRNHKLNRTLQNLLLTEAPQLSTAKHLSSFPKMSLTLWLTPVISKAQASDLPSNDIANEDKDEVIISATLFAKIDAADKKTIEEVFAHQGAAQEDTFEQLMLRLMMYVMDASGISAVVGQQQLTAAYKNLLKPEFIKQHFSKSALETFFEDYAKLNISARPSKDGDYAAVFFPIIPVLSLDGLGVYSIDFDKQSSLPADYLKNLEIYFKQLEVDFANSLEREHSNAQRGVSSALAKFALSDEDPSFVEFVFSHFFVATARAVVQAALDRLQVYRIALTADPDSVWSSSLNLDPASASLTSIAAYFPDFKTQYLWQAGDTPERVAALLGVEVDQIKIPAEYQNNPRAIPAGYPITVELKVTPAIIVQSVQIETNILRPWSKPVGTVDPQRPVLKDIAYTIRALDFFGSLPENASVAAELSHDIAKRFGVSVADLVSRNSLTEKLFRTGAKLVVGDCRHPAVKGETLQSIANYFYVGSDLNSPAEKLLASDSSIELLEGFELLTPEDDLYKVKAGETLNRIVADHKDEDWTVAKLLVLNPLIPVSWTAQHEIVIRDINYRISGSLLVVSHAFIEGDTPASLAAYYFPYLDPEQQKQKASLIQLWNPDIDWQTAVADYVQSNDNEPHPPVPGDLIRLPINETLTALAIYFFGNADEIQKFIDKSNTTNASLLNPGSTMSIPPVYPEITSATSFANLAQYYGLTIDTIADLLADVEGLFRDPGKENKPVELHIDDVPAQTVERLSHDLINYNDLSNSAASVGRFLMHGLRMPAPDDSNLSAVLQFFDNAEENSSPLKTYPLNALVGQEFAVPETPASKNIVLKAPKGLSWLEFRPDSVPINPTTDKGTSDDDNQVLVMPLDDREWSTIESFRTQKLDLSKVVIDALPVASVIAVRQSLEHNVPWEAGELPAAITASPEQQAAGEPSIWLLPDALLDKILQSPDKAEPFDLVTGRIVNGCLTGDKVQTYAWATSVEINLKQPPVTGETQQSKNLYILDGADDAGKERLFKLWTTMNPAGANDEAELVLLYASDPTDDAAGYRSDALDRSSTRILKTNLSTLSNPAPSLAIEEPLKAPAGDPNSGAPFWSDFNNDNADTVVSLLWQNSVTRSGGFYLHYVTSDGDGEGLPEYLFDHEGLGKLTLVVILKSQVGGDTAVLREFNNIVTVGSSLDLGQESLFVQARLATINSDTNLSTMVAEHSIAAHKPDNQNYFRPNIEAIERDIARTPGRLRAGCDIALVDGTTIKAKSGDTLVNIADRSNISIDDLLVLNRERNIFADNIWHPLGQGLTQVTANIPQGTVGFGITRPNPDPDTPEEETPQQLLQSLFNLAGYNISENDFFNASYQGLPAGPALTDGDQGDALALRQMPTIESDAEWTYEKLLNATSLAKANDAILSSALPVAKLNLYAGIVANAKARISVALQDLMGNRTSESASLSPIEADYGYLDELKAPDQWPGVSVIYLFTGDGSGPAELNITLEFTPEKFLPSPGLSGPASEDSAAAAKQDAQTSFFQIHCADISAELATSIGTAVEANTAASSHDVALQAIRDLSLCSYGFFDALSEAHNLEIKLSEPKKLGDIADTYTTSAGAIAESNSNVKATSLFGDEGVLKAPVFTVFKTGDSLQQIADRLKEQAPKIDPPPRTPDVPTFAERNQLLPLLEDSALVRAELSVPIADGETKSLQDFINEYRAPAIETNKVAGIVNSNPHAKLVKDQTLKLQGAELITREDDTFEAVTARFKEVHGIDDATVDYVAEENLNALYAGGQSILIKSYLLPPTADFKSVSGFLSTSVAELAKLNPDTPDLFSVGTALLVKVDDFSLTQANSDTKLSDIGQLLDLSLSELGSWNICTNVIANASLSIPALLNTSNIRYSILYFKNNDSFSGALPANTQFDDFININQHIPGLFTPGVKLENGDRSVDTSFASSFVNLADALGLDVKSFANKYKDKQGLPRQGAPAFIKALQSGESETIGSLVNTLRLDEQSFGDCNASSCNSETGLIRAEQTVTYTASTGKVYKEKTVAWDSLAKIAERINQQLIAEEQLPIVNAGLLVAQNLELTLNSKINVVPTVNPKAVDTDVTVSMANPIIPLTVSIKLSRKRDYVHPSFRQVAAVISAKTDVTAAPYADKGSSESLSLTEFADKFEQALPNLKVGSSDIRGVSGTPERWACGSSTPTRRFLVEDEDAPQKTLWVVEIGRSVGDSGFSYKANWKDAIYFSLPPLSTALWTPKDKVTVRKYASGTGLGDEEQINIGATDIDEIAKKFYQTMDSVLSPVASNHIFQQSDKLYKDMVAWKGQLAGNISQLILPLFDESDDTAIDTAKDAMRQRLLVELGAAYSVDTIVQTPFEVSSPCRNAETAARLSGQPIGIPFITAEGENGISLQEQAKLFEISATYLADVLQSSQFILKKGVTVTVLETKAYHIVQAEDTLNSIATILAIHVGELATDKVSVTKEGQAAGILANNSTLSISEKLVTANTVSDFITNLAALLDVGIPTLLHANKDLANLFQTGTKITLNEEKTVEPPGSPDSIAQQFDIDLIDLANQIADADLKAKGGKAPYTLGDAKARSYRVPPAYSFSTAKLALAGAGDNKPATQFTTTLFNAKVPVSARAIPLGLAYKFTDLEFDIQKDTALLGNYEQSSWIRFILPLERAAVNPAINTAIEIPVPLREYPERATITAANAKIVKDSKESAQLNSSWAYSFDMRRPVAAQDTQTLKIQLNSSANSSKAWADKANSDPNYAARIELYKALKAFEYAGPALMDDLGLLSLPKLSGDALDRAKVAVESFHDLAGNVVTAYQSMAKFVLVAPPVFDMVFSAVFDPAADDPTVYETIALSKETSLNRILTAVNIPDVQAGFSASNQQTLCEELGSYLNKIGRGLSDKLEFLQANFVNEDLRLIDHMHGVVYRLVQSQTNNQQIIISIDYVWPVIYQLSCETTSFEKQELERTILGDVALYRFPANARPSITADQKLSFTFKPFDILNVQSATGSLQVTRNQPLVYGRTTKSEFVYETGENPFPAVTIPGLVDNSGIDLSKFDPAGLESALSAFFEELTLVIRESEPDIVIPLAMNGKYDFKVFNIAATDSDVFTGLPLFLEPNKQFNVNTDWKPGDDSFVTQVDKIVSTRAVVAGVDESIEGRYTFSLKLFSTLSDDDLSLPLIEYQNIYFPIKK